MFVVVRILMVIHEPKQPRKKFPETSQQGVRNQLKKLLILKACHNMREQLKTLLEVMTRPGPRKRLALKVYESKLKGPKIMALVFIRNQLKNA